VNNSPVNYTDPSGHLSCKHANAVEGDCEDRKTKEILEQDYGVIFDGEEDGWTDERISAVYKAVREVGTAFSNGQTVASGAFKKVYGNVFTFTWSNDEPGNAGYTNAFNHITLYSVKDSPHYLTNHFRVIVHELGHAFNKAIGGKAQSSMTSDLLRDANGIHTDAYGLYYGFAGGWDDWQYGYDNTSSEVFADMFVGWVFNQWDMAHPEGLGQDRMDHMNKYMPIWTNQ
jgi:hypothetical protein